MATSTYRFFTILFCYTVVYLEVADSKIVVLNAQNEIVDEFPDVQISYSGKLLETLEGLVVPANPFNACDSIQDAFNLSVYVSFVLIDGNVTADCPGFLKIFNAQRAGFGAAILFGSLPTTGKCLELIIPAFKVAYDVGLKIMNKYTSKRVNGCCQSLRNRACKLETERYTAGDADDRCAICLEEYRNGEKLRVLPCNHEFHIKCIDTWLRNSSATCPLCVRRIILPDSNSLSSNNSDSSSIHSNEESPLISSQQSETSSSDSSLLIQRITDELVQILGEPNDPFQSEIVQEEGGHVELRVEVHDSSEISDNHLSPSTYGSVNNFEESDEYHDALA